MFFLFPLLLVGDVIGNFECRNGDSCHRVALRAQLLKRLPMDTISIGIFRNPNEKQRVILGLMALASVFVLKTLFFFSGLDARYFRLWSTERDCC